MMSKARGHKRQGKSDVKISSSNAKLVGNLILKDLSFKQIYSKSLPSCPGSSVGRALGF